MWALTVSFLTLWMGLFFFQEAVRVDKPLMMFLTVVLMLMNIIYVLIAFRWFLIIKLVDLETQEDVRRKRYSCLFILVIFSFCLDYTGLSSTAYGWTSTEIL